MNEIYWIPPEDEITLQKDYDAKCPKCSHCGDRHKREELKHLYDDMFYCLDCLEKID